jgi:phospholipid/cholesterol/gamma-HCH transport system substrate-binding protein
MERHANYALVGILTMLLIIGGLVLAVWLANVRFGEKQDRYRIVFQGPVRGVTQGGEVQFNGIKVGEVKTVRLSPQDANRILVDVLVDHATPVRTDSLASTEMQGISGVNAVLISAGTASLPLLRDVSPDDPPLIRSKPNALSSLLQSGGKMVENATEALDRANRLLSDRNIANLSGAVADLKQVSGDLSANRGMIRDAASAVAKLDAAMSDARVTMTDVRRLVQGDGRRAMANAADAAEELKATLATARSMLAGLSAQGKAVGSTTLPQITDTMRSLQETSDNLNTLIQRIQQDPRGTLIKSKSKERDLQQ